MANIAETPIDTLLALLTKKGRFELNEIASSLNIDPNVVESWVKILEDNNIVKVSYEFGKMFVELQKETKEQQSAQELVVNSEKLNIENELMSQRLEIEKYFEKYTQLGDTIKVAEGMFQEKFPEIEKKLETIDKIYTALSKENERLDNFSKNSEMLYNNINKKFTELNSKIDSIDTNTIEIADNQLENMRTVISNANNIEGELETLSRSKDDAINFIRKGIKEQINILEKDLAKIKVNIDTELSIYHDQLKEQLADINERGKEVNALYREVVEFKRNENKFKKELEESRIKFNDGYTRLNDYIETKGTQLKKEIKELSDELIEIKEEFGNISKLHDNINKNKDMLVDFKKEVEDIKNDIDNLSTFIKSINNEKNINTKKMDNAKAAVKLNEIKTRLESLDKKYLNLLNSQS